MLKLGSSRKTKFMKTACKVVPIFPIVKLRYLILLWKEFLCSQENLETWDALYIIRIWVVSVHSSSLVANMTSTLFLYYIEVKINTTFLVSWSKRKKKIKISVGGRSIQCDWFLNSLFCRIFRHTEVEEMCESNC